MRFSQRIGKMLVKEKFQVESIDDDLKNALWNAVYIFYLNTDTEYYLRQNSYLSFYTQVWHEFFKNTIDDMSPYYSTICNEIRSWFFNCQWYEIFDFIEFISTTDCPSDGDGFRNFCNSMLEREVSGYRFVDKEIVQITDPKEIEQIETTLNLSKQNKLSGVHNHLDSAIKMLSDRKKTDYRNSIKESISAVESIAKIISDDEKATLGKALDKIELKIGLHSALKKGFSSLYGYTNDEEGIRHAMLEETNISFEDAKYMLVVCSAFVNYLIVKSEKL